MDFPLLVANFQNQSYIQFFELTLFRRKVLISGKKLDEMIAKILDIFAVIIVISFFDMIKNSYVYADLFEIGENYFYFFWLNKPIM